MARETIKLITTGRRTGERREATLYAFPDGERLVIVASRGGAAEDPAWAHNLRARPRAEIDRGGAVRPVLATEVEGAERERLWTLITQTSRFYAGFQKRTKRQIPVFVLAVPAGDA
jgi:F420H(2)-dependent quinone reductase